MPKATLNITMDDEIKKVVERLRQSERRNLSNMMEILVEEALIARKLIKKK